MSKRIKALPQIRYYQPSTLRVRFGVSRLPHCLFCSAMWKMLNINNGFQWCIVEFLYELILPQWKRPRAWTKRLEPEHSSLALPLNGEQRGKAGWRRGREGCSQARPGPGGLGGLAGTTAQQRWAEGGCLKDQVKGKVRLQEQEVWGRGTGSRRWRWWGGQTEADEGKVRLQERMWKNAKW